MTAETVSDLLRFRDDGIPACALCAIRIRSDPESAFYAAASVGTSHGIDASEVLRNYFAAYHRNGHQPAVDFDRILSAVTLWVEHHRYTFGREAELRDGIAAVLDQAGLEPEIEHRLDRRSRLDVFLPAFGIAIEVKCKRAPDLWEQLRRYAAHPTIRAVVLVTTISSHGPTMRHDLDGKIIFVIQLAQRGL